ncbi:MAG: glutamine--fructose-6-phosphate transaminase (isomerizing) [Alphaproteobacteria bacterium]|nr:MAG: glutamine--fructose-6-phosphate transaminase (isomerizing) [Alphaproteobacteria bacterium]
MCGIVGFVGKRNATPLLIEGLRRLEYRGYDSAGVAVLSASGMAIAKTKGKVSALDAELVNHPIEGTAGIAHTRWATHGAPEQRNAHPHRVGQIALVHNGIIENYATLKMELIERGASFLSDTDTEVMSQWLHDRCAQGVSFAEAFGMMLPLLHGAYAIVALHEDEPDTLYVARKGSPMVVGTNDAQECWVGSDMLALAGYATQGYYLADGEYAILQPSNMRFFAADHTPIQVTMQSMNVGAEIHDKQGFAHFMLKEIHEQPDVIRKTLSHYYDHETQSVHFEGLTLDPTTISSITMVACGTSFYAAQVASYWFEQITHIPVRIDIASEYRYRHPIVPKGSAALFISQSGETADTLAAMRYAKEHGAHTIALVNVPTSTMAREADSVIRTLAGAEIGVASTKAFVAQLTTLAALVLCFGGARSTLSSEETAHLMHHLSGVAEQTQQVLDEKMHYDRLALALMYARDMLFIGRGTSYPLANEGALKMKELSYIHAEGYAAGELKHGPIALVDDGVPIIVIAPDDDLFDKSASNLEETAARKGNIVLISSKERVANFHGNVTHSVAVPACHPFVAPILYAVPLQLLSYYVALHKGADIDQPRNLAKSVTVE